ncbi:MAG: AmmeMemoRadiSam system protein B [Bdellovibrio sp.]|nr:MAG: AmmeMemoRadiSam system protein B [Bdellovibrio sp.]
MEHCRPPAVAGTFYPSDSKVLLSMVEELLERAPQVKLPSVPKAFIVPHAGYIYSGPIAAKAYKILSSMREQINTVVLIGASHYVSFEGLALSRESCWETPLGSVDIDLELLEKIKEDIFVLPEAHQKEHSLEVQIPFLQVSLQKKFKILPLITGGHSADKVEVVLEKLWGQPGVFFLISSDLSHYLPYEIAKEKDLETTRNILAKNYQALSYEDACGRTPIVGLLKFLKNRQEEVVVLDVKNSGDITGLKSEVVGYGAYAVV